MKCSYFVTFLVVYAAYSAIDSSSAQSILEECVNETLVLGDACQARPRTDFLKDFQPDIDKDVVLIVLKLVIRDVEVRYHHRFDLVKTDLGEFLLTLKSQMEFLTLDLPLLSDKVDRRYMELIPNPPGCLANITITDTQVKNWLLCGLTKKQYGIEKLLVKKLCFQTDYVEPNQLFLFKDTYSHECTDTPIKDSEWVPLKEDSFVLNGKRFINYGVTTITILLMIILSIYRRLFHTKARIFLCKLEPLEIEYKVVEKSKADIILYPDKMNIPPVKNPLCTCCCDWKRCKKEKCKRCKIERNVGTRSAKWKNITDEPKSDRLNITGVWFDIEEDDLISNNSFGLLTFLRVSMAEMLFNCCCNTLKLLFIFFLLIITIGVIVTVFMLYKQDPFHTLLDGIASIVVLVIVLLSMLVTNAKLGLCCCTMDFGKRIFFETIVFFFAFLVVAILARVIVILLIGFSLKTVSNIYTLVSSTVLFVVANGYYQLQKTHRRYQAFLGKCMIHINASVDSSNALDVPVFKNMIHPSITADEKIDWHNPKKKKLLLKFKEFPLFYLPNGESAINRNFFLELCKSDDIHSPGDLRWTALMDLLKFIVCGFLVGAIIFVLDTVAKKLDSSLYSQTPGTVLGGLIPIVFNYMFFPEQPEEDDVNLARLIYDEAKKNEKTYPVIDYEFEEKPKPVDISQNIQEPVDISQNIQEPVDISQNIQEPVDNSQNMQESVDISQNIQEPVDNSQNIQEPVDNSQNNPELVKQRIYFDYSKCARCCRLKGNENRSVNKSETIEMDNTRT